MPESLRKKTAIGLGWSFVETVLNQGVRFILGLILARLLTPHDYGLIGIALVFVAIMEDIVDGGFTNALIQKGKPTEKDYNTVFSTNLCISIILYCILFLAAPYIAVYFNDSLLTLIVRVISVILLIDALMFVPKTKLTKQMNFKIQTKVSFLSSISSAVVGIFMALNGFNVWALVGQQLTRHSIYTLSFLIISRQRLVLAFSLRSFYELFSFGSKLLMADFINSLYRQMYQVVIGKVYSPTTLGHYTRAHQFSSLFSVTFTQIVQKVTFPALSSIQNEGTKLKEAYRILIKVVMYIDFVVMLVLAAIAKPMIVTLLSEKWIPAVPYLQILCFSMLLNPLQAINLNMLKVKGRSDLFLRLEVIKKIIGLVPLALGIFVGIYWMLVASVVENVMGFFLNSHYSDKLLGYPIKAQIKDIMPALNVALFVSILVFSLSLLSIPYYVIFISQLLLAFALTIGLSEIMQIEPYIELKNYAKKNYIRCSNYAQ